MPDTALVNVLDYERAAEAALEPGPYGYFAGGACDELTLRDNREAFDRWQFRPRMLVDIESCTTTTTVLGTEVSMPLLVAPTAFHRMAHPDGEPGTARAAAAAGTIFCLSTLATSTPAEIASSAPSAPRWFQLYCFRDEGVTRALVEQAADAGFDALVLTVDAQVGGRRERDLRTGFTIPADIGVPSVQAALGRPEAISVEEMFALLDPKLTWRDLEWIADLADMPLLVKGVLTGEDARLAAEAGARGVIVSNHGGRQLDSVPASLDALPEVVDAVEGQVEVLMDGGIRRGTDVAKALALGARATLAGRALLWGLAAGGEEGARRVLEIFRDEIALALKLLGCPAPGDVSREHLAPVPR